jgi:signal transduction histidine kinase
MAGLAFACAASVAVAQTTPAVPAPQTPAVVQTQPAPAAPETVVEAAVRSVVSRFASPGCDFRTEIAPQLPLIRADAPSLTTALLNLLENAHKYTGADKRILLTVSQSGSTVCFAVTDNGRGFDPRQRSRIFEKFYRAEGPGSPVTGAGLGLHIVKSIVEAHGGRVAVETTARRREVGAKEAGEEACGGSVGGVRLRLRLRRRDMARRWQGQAKAGR